MPRIKKSILEDKSLSLKEKFLKGLPEKATYQKELILGHRSLKGDDLSKGEREWSSRYRDSRVSILVLFGELGGYIRRLPNGKLTLEEGPVPKDARQGLPWDGFPIWEHMGELTTALMYSTRERSPEQQALLGLANQLAREKLERKAKREANARARLKKKPAGGAG